MNALAKNLARNVVSKVEYRDSLQQQYLSLKTSKNIRSAAKAKASVALERVARLSSPEREQAFVRYALAGAFSL